MTKGWSAIVVDIGVAYKEDTDHVNEIMKQVGDELMKDAAWQSILMGVDLWGVDSFGDSSVILKVKLTTKSGQQWAASPGIPPPDQKSFRRPAHRNPISTSQPEHRLRNRGYAGENRKLKSDKL